MKSAATPGRAGSAVRPRSASSWSAPYRTAHHRVSQLGRLTKVQQALEQAMTEAVSSCVLEDPPDPLGFVIERLMQAHRSCVEPAASTHAENSELRAEVERLRSENERLRVQLPAAQQHGGKPARRHTLKSMHAALSAGVLAVDSRDPKRAYAQPMQKWSEDRDERLPKQVLLGVNQGAIQAVGTCYLATLLELNQVKELEESLEALKKEETTSVPRLTKGEHFLEEARRRAQKADEALKAAVARVEKVALASTEAVGRGLARDTKEYKAAVVTINQQEPGELEKLSAEAAAAANVGALEVGEKVEVEFEGKLQRAEVRRADGESDEYELSLWREVTAKDKPYEAGFDTSAPERIKRPRVRVYAPHKGKRVIKQELSAEELALAARRASLSGAPPATPSPDSMVFLALLYVAGERTLPELHALADFVSAKLPEVTPIVAPLKGEQRAAHKALDKYNGDYSRVTDVARMTMQCPTLRLAHEVLALLLAHDGFELVLIKDRLMLAFDTSATGGYKDMLINLRCCATGHIVEVQITLERLLEIKAGGGHAAYQIARLHKLFERSTYHYEGALGAAVIERLRCGIVRELSCRGTTTRLAEHFDALLEALRAPSCQLRDLRLVGCDWPEGRALTELVGALPKSGLKLLIISGMRVGGALPAALFDKCAEAEAIALSEMALTGGVPSSVGCCSRLKRLNLWDNQLEGPIPHELGRCAEVFDLALYKNKLTGGVPASLGKCAKLKGLYLYENQLEGSIPDELSDCVAMEHLNLSQNQLTGGVPAWLGRCTKLKKLLLSHNRLEGPVPVSELAKLTELEELSLASNDSLTIAATDKQELNCALPNTEIVWPV